jgi:L-lactate utilization protein LutC
MTVEMFQGSPYTLGRASLSKATLAPAIVTKCQKCISGSLLDRIEVPLMDYEELSSTRASGWELISPNADKHIIAQCDLGITEADYLLPETGTLVLRSAAEKPRAVSLAPRIHLAIVRPDMLRADLHQVFAEAKDSHYLVFITGPSRTADIELTVTLGVHGPKNLYVWIH